MRSIEEENGFSQISEEEDDIDEIIEDLELDEY